jgi:hypothetical protein
MQPAARCRDERFRLPIPLSGSCPGRSTTASQTVPPTKPYVGWPSEMISRCICDVSINMKPGPIAPFEHPNEEDTAERRAGQVRCVEATDRAWKTGERQTHRNPAEDERNPNHRVGEHHGIQHRHAENPREQDLVHQRGERDEEETQVGRWRRGGVGQTAILSNP